MDPNNSTGNCVSRNRSMRQWTKHVDSVSRMIYFNFLKFQPNFYWKFYYFSNPECQFIGNFSLWICEDKNNVSTNKEVNWNACVMFISFLSLCCITETNKCSVEKKLYLISDTFSRFYTQAIFMLYRNIVFNTLCA
jgi:hypothetical protein